MRLIQLRASEVGMRLFRNNNGFAWVGEWKKINKAGDVLIKNARPFHGGLGVGTGDLVGWNPVKITPEHLGKIFAVFANCECKNPNGRGRVEKEQQNFNDFVIQSGGFSSIVKSVEEFDYFINEQTSK